MTGPAASRASCRRASRTCWSTAPAASPSAWRPTSRRTISVEVINGTIALIDNPAIDLPELMEIIPGPDFPTGGIILGRAGIYSAYATGRGSIVMRGKVHIEAMRGDREAIIITEVPYPGEQGDDDREDGRTGARQAHRGHLRHSRRERPPGLPRRHRAEARRQFADVILNQLYRFTPLQTSFGANMVALNGGKPELLTLLDMLQAFVAVPRGSRQPAHQVPAAQGARPRPCAGRPGDRRRQYRRGHQADPQRAGSAAGARAVDGAALAGRATSRR